MSYVKFKSDRRYNITHVAKTIAKSTHDIVMLYHVADTDKSYFTIFTFHDELISYLNRKAINKFKGEIIVYAPRSKEHYTRISSHNHKHNTIRIWNVDIDKMKQYFDTLITQ